MDSCVPESSSSRLVLRLFGALRKACTLSPSRWEEVGPLLYREAGQQHKILVIPLRMTAGDFSPGTAAEVHSLPTRESASSKSFLVLNSLNGKHPFPCLLTALQMSVEPP